MNIEHDALNEVTTYAIETLGYYGGSDYLPELWDKDRYERFTGEWAGSNFIAAIAFEDTDWSAIAWAGRLQAKLDPNYEKVIFEPYTDWLITIRDET